MIKRIIYECEHCHKKRLMNPYQMREHEKICWYNLEKKSCVTCWYKEGYHNCALGVKIVDAPKPNINCPHWVAYEEAVEMCCEVEK